MAGPERKFKDYKPEWNLEAYNAVEEIDVILQETQPTRSVLMEYGDMDDYRGVTMIVDNIEKKIWVWVSEYAKHKSWTKKLKKTRDPKKFAALVYNVIANTLKYDLREFEVIRVDEGQETEDFEWLFMYEISPLTLYQKHYPKTEYQQMFNEREERLALEKAKNAMTKCPHCGWLLTGGKTVCPKCGKSTRET
ncbi:MAG: zinc ribbon domain-containing protein [Promethearchaeota archaeon]